MSKMKILTGTKRINFGITTIYIVLGIASLLCLLPFMHILAVSFSKNSAASAGMVTLWPKDFTTFAYQYMLSRAEFWRALVVSLKRVTLGAVINIVLVILVAYPLSKDSSKFKSRTVYAWIFFLTMLFNGGMIPTYMLVQKLGLIDRIWSLVLPCSVPAFNIVLMLNYFRQIPSALEEAATIDGAGQFRILWKIYIPCSVSAIATIGLFCIVFHWNSWFDGLIYMNKSINYPLQSYLQTIIVQMDMTSIRSPEEWKDLAKISDKTIKSAQIIIATLPILMIYPFIQRYFISGIVVGSVKS